MLTCEARAGASAHPHVFVVHESFGKFAVFAAVFAAALVEEKLVDMYSFYVSCAANHS